MHGPLNVKFLFYSFNVRILEYLKLFLCFHFIFSLHWYFCVLSCNYLHNFHFYMSMVISLPLMVLGISMCIILNYIKSRRMRWVGHVARMVEERGCVGSW